MIVNKNNLAFHFFYSPKPNMDLEDDFFNETETTMLLDSNSSFGMNLSNIVNTTEDPLANYTCSAKRITPEGHATLGELRWWLEGAGPMAVCSSLTDWGSICSAIFVEVL